MSSYFVKTDRIVLNHLNQSGDSKLDIESDDAIRLHAPSVSLTGGLDAKSVSLPTITFNGASNTISFPDNKLDALSFNEGTNTYLRFITTDTFERVVIGKDLNMSDKGIEDASCLKLAETSTAPAGADDQIWCKNTTPHSLYFTNDDGVDIQLTNGTERAVGAYIFSNAHCLSTGAFTNQSLSDTKALVHWSGATSSDTDILEYSSGGFTVKKAGTYEIYCRLAYILDASGSNAYAGLYVLKNGSDIKFSGVGVEQYDSIATYYFATVHFYYTLAANDVITVNTKQSDATPVIKLYHNATYGGELLIRSVSF